MRKQDVPMRIHACQQSFPVKVLSCFEPDMIDIGAIKTFTVVDIQLTKDKFLWRKQKYIHTHEPHTRRFLQPGIINPANVIDCIENDINEKFAFVNLAKPPYIIEIRLVTFVR